MQHSTIGTDSCEVFTNLKKRDTIVLKLETNSFTTYSMMFTMPQQQLLRWVSLWTPYESQKGAHQVCVQK